MTREIVLAVTMGDPTGIGIEITAKAWLAREEEALAPFFMIGSIQTIREQLARLPLELPSLEITSAEEAAGVFRRGLPVLALDPSLDLPAATIAAIRLGTELCLEGRADALVTNPIHKKRLYEAGFTHPGHTEYLAALTGVEGKAVMMLACDELKVVPATIHIPLKDVPNRLNEDLLQHVITTTHVDLITRFGIDNPRLVVAALNPHAGEDGSIGLEEITVIRPAIDKLRADGINVSGPWSADSLFHAAARKKFDAAICMYHDQALIPIKTIDFDGGVNVTLGLPIIRTSPDHGTAEDIAGRGIANPASLIAALKMAAQMATAVKND